MLCILTNTAPNWVVYTGRPMRGATEHASKKQLDRRKKIFIRSTALYACFTW